MPAPLYTGAEPQAMPRDGHRGLWYDRFFNRYSAEWTLDETAKKGWIDGVVGRVGDNAQIDGAVLRIACLCASLQGKTRIYAGSWHFATGLGNPHPVENGFLWHPTLGTPYIGGSAVKGIVRAWVEAWMPFESEKDRLDTLCRWFGSEHKDFRKRKELRENGYRPPAKSEDIDTAAGAFIFFDALPIAPVALKCDVMTPHMGKWYEQGGEIDDVDTHPERVPADWHDPVPIYFLVADRPQLQFAVAPRTEAAMADLDAVLEALDCALQWLGAGAKTAVGYGLMDRSADAEMKVRESLRARDERLRESALVAKRAKEREAARTLMDPLERAIDDFLRERTDKCQSEIAAVIAAVKQGKLQGQDKQRVARWLEQKMTGTPGQWKPRSQAKRPEKDKEHQNTLLVLGWLKGQ